MLLSRWKLMAGVLGVSIGGLAAAASQCPKIDKTKGRAAEPPAVAEAPKLPPSVPAPSLAPAGVTPPALTLPLPTPAADAPKLPDLAPSLPSVPTTPPTPSAVKLPEPTKAPESVKPVELTPISGVLPQLPDVPAPSPATKPITPKPIEMPETPKPAPASDLLPPPPAKPGLTITPPAASDPVPAPGGTAVPPPVGKPTGSTALPPLASDPPPAPPVSKPSSPAAGTPSAPPAAIEFDIPPAKPTPTPAPIADIKPVDAKVAATKYRILLRVGEGEPTFEVKCGDDLVLKVACEKVDIKSPEKGAGLSAVTARGKVRFAGFGAEGTCDELSFMAGTGEVSMSGEVKVQVKDKLGRVESELTTASMKYKIDASAVGNSLKP